MLLGEDTTRILIEALLADDAILAEALREALVPGVQKALRRAGDTDADAIRLVFDRLQRVDAPSARFALRSYVARARASTQLDATQRACDAALAELGPLGAVPTDAEWKALADALSGAIAAPRAELDAPLPARRVGTRATYVMCGRNAEWTSLNSTLSAPGPRVTRLLLLGPEPEDHARFRERLRDWGDTINASRPALFIGDPRATWSHVHPMAYAEQLWATVAGAAPPPASLEALREAIRPKLADHLRRAAAAGRDPLRVFLLHPPFVRVSNAAPQERDLLAYHAWLEELLAWQPPDGALQPLDRHFVVIQPLAWREEKPSLLGRFLPFLRGGGAAGPDLAAWKTGSWHNQLVTVGPLAPLTLAEVVGFLHDWRNEEPARAAELAEALVAQAGGTSEGIYNQLQDLPEVAA